MLTVRLCSYSWRWNRWCRKIVVSGGEIQSFGNLVGNSQVENAGVGYTYGTVDLINDIFSTYTSNTLSNATTLGSGTNDDYSNDFSKDWTWT